MAVGEVVEQSLEQVGSLRLAGDAAARGSVEVEVEVRDLVPGQKIRPLRGQGDWAGFDALDEDTAVLFGLVLGDGHTNYSANTVYMNNSEPEVLAFLRGYAHAYGKNWHIEPGDLRLYDLHAQMMKADWDLTANLPDRTLPEVIFTYDPDSTRGVLRGLFSANGGAMPKHGRIDLKTTCLDLARQVQMLLLVLGFSPYITTNAEQKITWANGTYVSRESYDVNLGSPAAYEKFQDDIGFLHAHKSVRIPAGPMRAPRVTTVRRVELVGTMDVYEFTEARTHWGWANGFKSHSYSPSSRSSHSSS